MKIATIIFLIGIYVIGMLRPIAPFIEYELNKGYISEFLCINKDKPQNITTCYGKCYLTNKVKEAQQNDTSETPRSINIQEYPLGFVETLSVLYVDRANSSKHNTGYFSSYSFAYAKGIDRPPSFS